ncbi:MAG: hypothetical protein O7A68_07695 [Alphaproteobacteria bacterium]|nr:hypothetical protein [Alphaproteobacteria bacterium]
MTAQGNRPIGAWATTTALTDWAAKALSAASAWPSSPPKVMWRVWAALNLGLAGGQDDEVSPGSVEAPWRRGYGKARDRACAP